MHGGPSERHELAVAEPDQITAVHVDQHVQPVVPINDMAVHRGVIEFLPALLVDDVPMQGAAIESVEMAPLPIQGGSTIEVTEALEQRRSIGDVQVQLFPCIVSGMIGNESIALAQTLKERTLPFASATKW